MFPAGVYGTVRVCPEVCAVKLSRLLPVRAGHSAKARFFRRGPGLVVCTGLDHGTAA